MEFVEKFLGGGNGSAAHIYLWVLFSKFVNQQFLILIITKKWVQLKSIILCFPQSNEQAE